MIEVPTMEAAKQARTRENFIGEGGFRQVYRSPGSMWVYKFEHWEDERNNAREYRNYLKFKDILTEVSLPKMILLENKVLAAEYIDGFLGIEMHSPGWDCTCVSKYNLDKCYRRYSYYVENYICDINSNNIKFSPSRNKIYVIDIGGRLPNEPESY